ncbi:response regulator transcription factor [Colwellia psychrerythraea]|uniref:Two component transcriptional regulator, winged helix family n=1 Tax=Colwellia psychrerythraea TaxID=28229 RepID=A0A099KA30_COLPS|nr:response regulator transcription factor [Colwellia psychrerythraea]KGJ86478.1 two component transcriptional regulator, winged helix family [Colwellia psychrerythraea]
MSKTRILLIEDDAEISRLTAMYLDVEGYQVDVIDDGSLALEAIKVTKPELIILDLMLPGMSGIEICKAAREFYQPPILILTACDDDVSEVSLLKMGADDYLVKPLRPHVLVARIEALLRRNQNYHNKPTNTQSNSALIINEASNQVTFQGKLLTLTGSEYEMLKLLHQNAGEVISREQCCQVLRGIDYDFSNRSIDMRISGLRKKLGDDQVPYKIITTIRNQGYKLINE